MQTLLSVLLTVQDFAVDLRKRLRGVWRELDDVDPG